MLEAKRVCVIMATMKKALLDECLTRASFGKHFPAVVDALLHAFEVSDCRSIADLHNGVSQGEVRFGLRGPAAVMESRPHD